MSNTKRGRKPILRLTSNVKASTNLERYRFLTIDAVYPSSEGAVALGIAGERTAIGNYASITVTGIEFIEVQEAVTKDALLSVGTDGKAKVKGTDEYVMGIALDAGDAGDIVRIKLN